MAGRKKSGSRMSRNCALREPFFGSLCAGSDSSTGSLIMEELTRALGDAVGMRSLCDKSSCGLGSNTLSAPAPNATSRAFFPCFAGSASYSPASEEPEDVAEWPAGDSIRIKDVKDRCPTGVVLRVQMNQQRYRVSYHGRQTTRSWRRDGHAESLRRIVQWAWKQHTDGTSTK